MNVVIPEEQKTNENNMKKGPGDNGQTKGEGATPIKILRNESAFTKSLGRLSSARKRLTFADELGDPISENVFVEHLHYSSNHYNNADLPKGCCSVS